MSRSGVRSKSPENTHELENLEHQSLSRSIEFGKDSNSKKRGKGSREREDYEVDGEEYEDEPE